MSTHSAAYSRQRRRSMSRSGCTFFSRNSRLTWVSIGMPWLSQPGRSGESNPRSDALRTSASFQILLDAVPMWRWPFE
jgi:hypothetical protein